MQHGVSVDLELDGDLPKVIINQTEIEQVFVNVINNAIEASRPGQKVSVRLKRDGEQFVTFVEDRGRGMTPEETGRIFDPFYTTRQAEGGTGLGLSLTYSIVRQHDGTIDIESQPGRGTRVAIRLPAEGTPAPTKGTRNDGGNQNPDRR
jgi:two-component system NtrC family sensor kinase